MPVAGTSVDTDELDAFCGERLDSFKLPRQWAVVVDLPRTASGKVQRALLRQVGPDQTV